MKGDDSMKNILTLIAQASAIEVNNDLKKRREEKEDKAPSLKEKAAAITEAWLTWQPYLQKNKERAK